MRSDTNLNKKFAAEGVDTRQYGSMPSVLDTTTEIAGRGRVLRSHSFSGHETDSVFYNIEGAQFVDISAVSGMDSIADGRGFAYLDYDRDGWQDVVLVNSNAPQLELFRNCIGESVKNAGAIHVRLRGGNTTTQPAFGLSSRDGYGAHVLLKAGGRELRREARCGDGFAAQNSSTLLIGIGQAATAEDVRVLWPSGKITAVGTVPAGATVTVEELSVAGTTGFRIEMLPPAQPSAATAPEIPLAHLDVALPADGAKLRVFTMMATSCPICRSEIPHFARLKAGLPGTEVALYAVPVDANATSEMLREYATKHSPAWEILADLPESEREKFRRIMHGRFGETPLPSTIVTNAAGDVVLIKKGTIDLSAARQLLRRLTPANS
ncbi:MAG: ASPIC/UnbV domain-containing protein [Verrucomicrobiales bacterium]